MLLGRGSRDWRLSGGWRSFQTLSTWQMRRGRLDEGLGKYLQTAGGADGLLLVLRAAAYHLDHFLININFFQAAKYGISLA